MYMHGMGMRRNPWYRGYMPRSYVAPTFIASFACAVCMIVFGVFLLLGGVMITAFANIDLSPKGFKPLRIVGPVFIAAGLLLLVSSIGVCCFARHSMMKQEKKRKNQQEQPIVPPPAGSYPQQPSPGQYHATEQYPAAQQYPPGYPSQQPPGLYPAAQQYAGAPLYPPGSEYPTSQYPPQQPYQQGYPPQDGTGSHFVQSPPNLEMSKSSQPSAPGFKET